jgi:hypothetical protein
MLQFLHKSLGPNPTAVPELYDLPEDYARDMWRCDYSKSSVQAVADHIGCCLGISQRVRVTVLSSSTAAPVWMASEDGCVSSGRPEPSVDYSGLYQVRGGDHSEITLVKRSLHGVQNVLAILIHEYAHHYLHRHGFAPTDDLANEQLTDIATAYLGLGHYVLSGYPYAERLVLNVHDLRVLLRDYEEGYGIFQHRNRIRGDREKVAAVTSSQRAEDLFLPLFAY